MKVWTAVWEWNDGNGEDPEAFVATTQELVEREAFRYMRRAVEETGSQKVRPSDGESIWVDDLPEWLPENPPRAVDENDVEQVRAWLAGFRNAATAPWLTISEEPTEVVES